MDTRRRPTPRDLYLITISLIGVILVIYGIVKIPTYDPLLIFFLLVLLAITAQITSTMTIGGDIIIEVSTAVSLASVALYGPFAACLVVAAGMTSVTVVNLRSNWPGRRGAIERIGFNIGMATIAIFLAGLVFYGVQSLFSANVIAATVLSWLLAAIVNDQVNLWLLIGMIHLQSGVKPSAIWNQHKWAIPINVLVMSVGGGILAIAIEQLGILGIAIFFLPIALSAYSFRLYVNQTRQQMENLEDLVDLRTQDLAQANKELAALSKEKDSFLAVLTHDMRTPLTSIKGYASIIT